MQRGQRSQVKKALADALVHGQPSSNPEDVLQTIEQMMAQVVHPT